MRILPLIAAAAVAALALPAAASAAPASSASQVRVVVKTGHHSKNRRAYWRKDCRTTYRHHHKVRTCKRVRAWR